MSSSTRPARLRGPDRACGRRRPRGVARCARGRRPPRTSRRRAQQPAGRRLQRRNRPRLRRQSTAIPAPQASPAAPGGGAERPTGPGTSSSSRSRRSPIGEGLRQGPSNNTEICYTTRDFVSDQGQPVLAVAMYDVKGVPEKMSTLHPATRPAPLARHPVRRRLGRRPGRFAICLPNGCFAEGRLKEDFVNSMKKGTTLNVSVQNQVAQRGDLPGAAGRLRQGLRRRADRPAGAREQQKKLQEELQKRGDELRAKLQGSRTPRRRRRAGTPRRSGRPLTVAEATETGPRARLWLRRGLRGVSSARSL